MSFPSGPRALDIGLWQLESVDLAQLDEAQLHDRVESKVILNHVDIPRALDKLRNQYQVLEHQGQRMQRYRTEYFDDDVLSNYHNHHNQKRNRLKARYRTYDNSSLTYFELKRDIANRTVKERRKSTPPAVRLWAEDALLFHEATGLDPSHLSPSLTVSYDRILLVKADRSERVTIDINLRFGSEGRLVALRDLAVCEFKQPSMDRNSPAMTSFETKPQRFSKYCMGLAVCHPELRRNRFKPVFHRLRSLQITAESLRSLDV